MEQCAKCPKQESCHEQSIGDLQMIRSIDGFFQTREMAKLEKVIKIFWDRLNKRHQILTGR